MRKFSLVEFSVDHPKLVVILSVVVTLLFMTQFPKMRTDTDPKNMLPATSAVRVWNDKVEKDFSLYKDMIVLGIVNDKGILNSDTLAKIQRITDGILQINGVAARDVSSFTTIDNVTADKGTLNVAPLMTTVPGNEKEIGALKKNLYDNPLFINRIISKDGKTAAVYVPLENGANGKEIADKIRGIVKKEKGDEQYYIAGDPVARDTFGADMFKLMAVFAPIAGMVMLIVRYLMFRDLFLSVTLMMDAMMSIVWSMGLLIGLGFPIHIMSSMAPVFLMAIATDSMHIFNEFYFRYREKRNKRVAIIETMNAVSRPVRNTALATAAGFAVLLFMNIVPVKVFGGLVAFGTISLRILSFSFIPAMFTFVKDEKLEKIAQSEDKGSDKTSNFLKKLAGFGAHHPKNTVFVGLALFVIAVIGLTKITVNNNLVEWFKKGSDVRVADSVINKGLGGTSLGYVVASGNEDDYIKTPEAMRYIDGLQRHLEKLPVVGKTTSVVNYVKRINRVLHDDDPKYDTIPDSKAAIGQYLFLFGMSAKPSDLDNVVDYPFRRANIWVQLKTWDAQAMREVIKAMDDYKKANPSPIELKPSGIAYFNLVWNDEVLWDMVKGFILALIAVFAILAYDFRSIKWAIVGYTPLLFTVLLLYGVVGFIGKDFDMPISVLSTLSLGMAVDFAIHFVSRFRQRLVESSGLRVQGSEQLETHNSKLITDALLWTAARPGKGIMRNAILFAASFAVMIFAPLTPYITVGAFIVSMMLLSALMTLIYLPALVTLLQGWLLKGEGAAQRETYSNPI
jgi:uncharacterized protein